MANCEEEEIVFFPKSFSEALAFRSEVVPAAMEPSIVASFCKAVLGSLLPKQFPASRLPRRCRCHPRAFRASAAPK